MRASPDANRAMARSLSAPRMRPWTSSTVSPKRFLRSRVALFRGGEIAALGFFDQRAHPVDATAFVDARSTASVTSRALERQRAGVDLLPAGGLFAHSEMSMSPKYVSTSVRGIGVAGHQKIDGFALAR